MSDVREIDLFVIGGGVNGAGIARDAAGRGLSVVLCEKDDLAQGTSSRSGKLVHGGLRYLEHYEFRLVREALIEREVLLEAAPHIIWPMRFVLPHSPLDRPAWLIRTGLFLYDHLGGRKRLPGTRALDLRSAPEGAPLKDDYTKGFEYSDCWVDDARLVLLNALDASERGAMVLVRTRCTRARREDDAWLVDTVEAGTGRAARYRARAIVNAGGPWVSEIIGGVTGSNSARRIRMVKGSHLIVPKFWDGPQAYLVQNHDRRVIFINPYEGDKALIGTTDIPYEGEQEKVVADEDEIAYLIDAVNRYFEVPLTRSDVLETFSGIRPLLDDEAENPSAVTRDYTFDLDRGPRDGSGDDAERGAPMLSVFGGKITTFRKLAEHAMEKLEPFFPDAGRAWTRRAPLPGGDIPDADFDAFLAALRAEYPWLPEALATHYGRLYGTRARALLGDADSLDALGRRFGPLLHEAEAAYLREHEWATAAEDVLRRRTKHALTMNAAERDAFAAWFEAGAARSAA